MERETFVHDRFQIIWLDHLARFILDSNFGAVKVSDDEVDSSQRFLKGDLLLHQQVSTFALEALVGLLLRDYNHITGFDAWILVSFTMERVLVVVRRALIDRCFKNLLLLYNLLAVASLALVLFVDDFSLAAAFVAGTLGL